MIGDLAGDNRRQDVGPAVLIEAQNRRRSLIAAGFDTQDCQGGMARHG